MKDSKKLVYRWMAGLLLVGCAVINSQLSTACAQGTAFTYQGVLDSGGSAATGSYDLTLSLFTAASGGTQVGSTQTFTAVGVTNGLFTVSPDFGAVFSGSAYWLQIGVRTNGASTFMALTPLQELTPTPYSITAQNLSGTLPASQLPAGVVTNNEPNVTLGNLSVSTKLTLPQAATVNAGTSSFLISDNTLDFYAGLSAGNLTTTGAGNTGVGFASLLRDSSGTQNTALGSDTMSFNTTGSDNVAVGTYALANVTTDTGLVAVGYKALQNDTTGNASFFGVSGNTAVGFESLQASTQGIGNTAVGYLTGNAITTGYQNTVMGFWAGLAMTTAQNDTGLGYFALGNNTTSQNNTAVGAQSMTGSAGSTGGGNSAVGAMTLGALTTGYNSEAFGFNALNADTTGFDNVAIGVSTLLANTTGYQNTSVGTYSFQNMTAGTGNVGLGYYAGNSLTTGTNNIYIGNAGASSETGVMRLGTIGTQSLTYIAGTKVGINTSSPTTALDVNGEFIAVEGASGIRAYIGDDGSGGDVQIGSLKSGVTAVSCYNEADSSYMHLYVGSITINGGSDLAEPFQISSAGEKIPQGAVVVIDEKNPGHLKLSAEPYDARVAGVVSGANGIHPGIQMQQQGLLEGGQNVALTGRVYVQADASNGAIQPGDLLTSSSIPGRAMKVTDHNRAQGAILGKAMTSLHDGQGMVLVLVTLQ